MRMTMAQRPNRIDHEALWEAGWISVWRTKTKQNKFLAKPSSRELGFSRSSIRFWSELKLVRKDVVEGTPVVPRWAYTIAHDSSLDVLQYICTTCPDAAYAVWRANGDDAVVIFAEETYENRDRRGRTAP